MKAVFFDLDGVLVNSEVIHQGLFKEFLEQEQSPIPPERFYLLIGSHKSLNPWSKIMEGIDLQESLEEFRERMKAYRNKRLSQINFGEHVFFEVRSVLEQLKERGIKIACASSSNIQYITEVLKGGHIYDLFDLIVSCDDFKKSKPEPDIYLYCMNYFGFEPQDCIVVEDSEIGIQAGKSAGMKVLARKDYHFGLNQSQADGFIDDLNGIFGYMD